MSFKMTKTFNATMTGDNGLAMGTQQIEAEVIYTITLIQVIDEGTAHATINASVNGQTPWICPYISRHLLSLNPLLARCRRYSRGER